MSGVGTNLQVPMFLKAGSPLGLHRLMLLNNIKSGTKYHYQDIGYVNGAWFCWYYKTIDLKDAVRQTTSDENAGKPAL